MMVNNKMQIFTYDFANKKSQQITKGNENKHEASWSPCGTQLVFEQESNGKNQIVSLNLLTNTYHYITDKKDQCCYPHWSPIYEKFPVVT